MQSTGRYIRPRFNSNSFVVHASSRRRRLSKREADRKRPASRGNCFLWDDGFAYAPPIIPFEPTAILNNEKLHISFSASLAAQQLPRWAST